jgi:hypothetical protein
VAKDMVREEQFGPVLPGLRHSDIDDAIARANDTPLAGAKQSGIGVERGREGLEEFTRATILLYLSGSGPAGARVAGVQAIRGDRCRARQLARGRAQADDQRAMKSRT